MAVVDVFNLEKEKVGEIELSEAVFGVPVKKHVLHEVVVSQLARRRAGTAAVKGRSDVYCSGAKLWRQKGTGRARVGDAGSPIRRGGGVVFGPQPRSYDRKVSKKVRKSALCMALSDKLGEKKLIVVDGFSISDGKTKTFARAIKNFDVRKALIVTSQMETGLDRSSRNVPWAKVMKAEGLNVYDILTHDHLLMDKSVIGKLQEALVS
ncbi:MAG TPA: 50S ribosomal protein L4 [Desulfobacteraceae bacterium]|nr:50S ribosomal protein L4 [Desulfobacteraceae bacterium]